MPRTMSIPRTGPKLSAGVLTADLTRLGDELAILRGTGCWAHVDVMDGSFCPQLTVGPGFVAAVAVHAEATRHPHRTLQELTALAAARPAPVLRGVAISPGTPVTAVEPLLELTDLVLVLAVDPGWPGQPVMVGVDGGVTMANAAEIAGWGADVVVSGSAIYDGRDPAGNLDRMLARLSTNPERSNDDQQRPGREDRGPAHPDEDHPDSGGGP